jgi:hypothetical protein
MTAGFQPGYGRRRDFYLYIVRYIQPITIRLGHPCHPLRIGIDAPEKLGRLAQQSTRPRDLQRRTEPITNPRILSTALTVEGYMNPIIGKPLLASLWYLHTCMKPLQQFCVSNPGAQCRML